MPSASPARRLRWLAAFAALLVSLTACASALAQADAGGEGGGGPPAPYYPSIDTRGVDHPTMRQFLAHGLPFLCGQAKTARDPHDVDCRIEGTLTVPTKVARFLGLHSRVLASGVFGDRTDHFENSDGDDQGRAYFLRPSSAVRSRLEAKRVHGLGVALAGTITPVGFDKAYCGTETPSSVPCKIKAPKRITVNGEEGELLCWRFMPFWLATPAHYGKMCPRPVNV